MVWHKRLRKGYGWIFPCRDGVFNIGVGLTHSHSKQRDGRADDAGRQPARDVRPPSARCYAPARELMRGGTLQGDLKGAPLRCSLDGARYSRPGLLVTGEAAGSTYAFTGEGIGKAMETGMLAARSADRRRAAAASMPRMRAATRRRSRALKPRFDLYERANRVNDHPWLADLLIWRANARASASCKRMRACSRRPATRATWSACAASRGCSCRSDRRPSGTIAAASTPCASCSA